MSIKTCNNCDRRKCKLTSRNDFPNMMPRPYRPADKLGFDCKSYLPINRKVPFHGRILKDGKVINGD